nr:CoA transferase [Nocardioides panaciterrulae]
MRAAVAGRGAEELEEAAAVAGAILVKVRDVEEWRAHPQGQAVARRPLLGFAGLGEAAPRPWREAAAGDGRPLAGVRVLDLTRVIAGPVATRDLAFAGADVLRLDSPRPPEIEWQHLDTGQGKRCAVVDLATRAGDEVLERLLASADVVVTGYRPGSLDRFGLEAEQLAARFPGLVVGRVSAWDTGGPWSARRGFDSIVQATSGIAVRESGGAATPGALPAQALDHSAGHLLAAGVMSALRRQRAGGGSHLVSISLARVAHELLAQPGGTEPAVDEAALPAVEADGPAGRIRSAPPALDWAGAPPAYSWVGRPWGADEPAWA